MKVPLHDELPAGWLLTPDEREQIVSEEPHNQLGFAVQLKHLQEIGRFPRHHQEISKALIKAIAEQLDIPEHRLDRYQLTGRTSERHRRQIRAWLDVRPYKVSDDDALVAWLGQEVLAHEQHDEHLKAQAQDYFKRQRIEPPSDKQLARLIRSAIRSYEDQFFARCHAQLPASARLSLDALLHRERADKVGDQERYPLSQLKASPGRVGLNTLLAEVARLKSLQVIDRHSEG